MYILSQSLQQRWGNFVIRLSSPAQRVQNGKHTNWVRPRANPITKFHAFHSLLFIFYSSKTYFRIHQAIRFGCTKFTGYYRIQSRRLDWKVWFEARWRLIRRRSPIYISNIRWIFRNRSKWRYHLYDKFSDKWFQCDMGPYLKFVSSNWCVRRGRRSSYKPMDVLFMALVTLKHGGTWDSLGKMFEIKGPTFKRLITRFIDHLSDHFYELFVEQLGENFTMTKLMNCGNTFRFFPVELYATDITFQLAYRPSVNFQ